MFRLSEAATAFAKIDQIPDDAVPALDKFIRNLSQRHYLPPAAREGRADLYSVETVCALRLAERAAVFGIDRVSLDSLLRFLHSAPSLPTRYRQGDGFRVGLTHIEEAVERARAGEDFTVGLVLGNDGRVQPRAWFAPDEVFVLGSDIPATPSDAAFRLDAGRLIRAVLAVLNVK